MGLRANAVGILVLLSTGCSATVVDEGESGDPPEATTRGSVTVEKTASLTDGSAPGAVQSRVSARFMRISGNVDQELAERIVGAPVRLPALGSCEWLQLAAPLPLPPTAAEASIELLDVGDILLHAEARTTQLAARAFPDVGDYVSGVVYTSRDDTNGVVDGHSFLIETTGSDLVDGFSVRVDAPAIPTGITIERLAANDGDGSDGVQLFWRPGRPSAGDRIYVDISPSFDRDETTTTEARALRCSFDDTGFARLPAGYAEALPDGELDLALHRFRRTLIGVSAIDEAVVDFDFAVTAQTADTATP